MFDISADARQTPLARWLRGLSASNLTAAILAIVLSSGRLARAESAVPAHLGEPERQETKFLIRPFIAMDQLALDVTRGDTTLDFVPNTQLAIGMRVGYSGFSISASFDVEASEDEDLYGKTDYLALQAGRAFRVADRELFISGFLQYHEGLYLESSGDIAPGSAPLVFPEMTVLSLGLSASYYLNPEFSFDDTFIEFRPRQRSVGSWTLRMSTGLMGYDNADQPIVPEQARARFGSDGTLTGSAALYLGAMGGYTVDLRFFDSWCAAGSLLVGVTVAREEHRTAVSDEQSTTLAPSALFALALGYAGETFHAGIFTYADAEGYQSGPVEQTITRIAVALFTGVRF